MTEPDSRDFELPPKWSSWPLEAKIEYLTNTMGRDELFMSVAEAASLDVDPGEVTPKSRLRKRQLAVIAYRLGEFRR